MAAGLGQVNLVDACAGALLGGHQRGVGRLACGAKIHHRALDHATRLTFTDANDVQGALGKLADKDTDFGGADFHGTDELGSRSHVSREKNYGRERRRREC